MVINENHNAIKIKTTPTLLICIRDLIQRIMPLQEVLS
jgi:hypothetical protein